MNKMKDLSILARAARTLTSAGRVAAVLFTVMLTMTAQTAWAALDYDFNDDRFDYQRIIWSVDEIVVPSRLVYLQ